MCDQAMRHWGDGQHRWRSRESPVSSRSPRGLAIRRARSPFGLCGIALCANDVPGSIRHCDENAWLQLYRRSPSRVGQCGRGKFPSRFHLPYPDRDHTSQSLLAERLSTSTLEPVAQQQKLVTVRVDEVRVPVESGHSRVALMDAGDIGTPPYSNPPYSTAGATITRVGRP
jgi:hypothetical protein